MHHKNHYPLFFEKFQSVSRAQDAKLSVMKTQIAFNAELPAGSAPEWVQLLPVGPNIIGRDGRSWKLSRPESIVALFSAANTQAPVDWEHASEHRAPVGLPAPAAGWISQIEVRQGALWGRVEWTPTARNQISNREYRFLSPVFTYNAQTREVIALKNAALTNQPNLNLTALNQQEDTTMTIAAILAALKLAETADINAAVTAINQMQNQLSEAKALNAEQKAAQSMAQNHDLSSFVPRADYDAAHQRALNAEQQLSSITTAQRDAAIEIALKEALTTGKIVPASLDYHRAACREQGGLERFTAFASSAPTIAPDSGLTGKNPTGDKTALNAEERTAAKLLGLSVSDFMAAKTAQITQIED